MRLPIILVLSLTGLALTAAPAMAAGKCGFSASGKWGLLTGRTFVVAGDATAKSCNGITLTLGGEQGIVGARPEDIMTAKGAASFATNLTFVTRSFIPEDERIATQAGKMPWQSFPELDKVTAAQTQLALRRSDGLADTVFFRVAHGELCFFQVRAVEGSSYNDLLEKGDLLSADL
jgi:hypothetical protein